MFSIKYFTSIILNILIFYNISKMTCSKKIYFTSSEWQADPNYLADYHCDVKHSRLSVFYKVLKEIPINARISIETAANPVKGKRTQVIFTHYVDICKLTETSGLRGFIQTWLMDSINNSNFPKRCPIAAGNYSWVDISTDNLLLPSFMPTARYELVFGKKIYFVSSENQFNFKYVEDIRLDIVGNHSQLNVYFWTRNEIPPKTRMIISATINPAKERRRRRPTFVHDADFCQLTRKTTGQITGFIKAWLIENWRESNFPQICPVPKGNYSWLGISMDNLKIPELFLNAKYEINATFYTPRKSQQEKISEVLLLVELK